jgi:anti-sigma factor ChrR (cupin superfamily)
MTNEFELNDEQLAAVAGGSSSRININQLAANLGLQNNAVNANTNVLAIGGGRNSSTAAAAEGSVNNVGNLLVGINSNNA